MNWPFKKYSGSGNDFILFENLQGSFLFSKKLIQRLCHRQKGIGADGVILLENSLIADFRFRIFNPDGSEAEMCGNGLRCFVKSLKPTRPITVETMHSVLTAAYTEKGICVEMGSPKTISWNIPIEWENEVLKFQFIDSGVPHAVLFASQIDQINLMKLGSFVRHSPHWAPSGTNVTLAQLQTEKLKIRTYERGVEGETLACGTGAVAAALTAAYLYRLASPIKVETLSGEELTIGFSLQDQNFTHITMEGRAEHVFSGTIEL